MHSFTKTLRDIGFLTIALTLALVANFAYGQWANPTEAPTGGNVAAPINTSGTTQTKSGNFGAVDVFAAGTSTATLGMRALVYCDLNGENCVTSAAMGGSSDTGSWDYVSAPQVSTGNGSTLTVNTGFGYSPSDVQVDLINISPEGGYTRGDVIHNITSTAGHNDRWHDYGLVIYSESNGNINLKVSQKGFNVIRKDAPTAAWTVQQININPSNWAFVLKAKSGDVHSSLTIPAAATVVTPPAPPVFNGGCPPGSTMVGSGRGRGCSSTGNTRNNGGGNR